MEIHMHLKLGCLLLQSMKLILTLLIVELVLATSLQELLDLLAIILMSLMHTAIPQLQAVLMEA